MSLFGMPDPTVVLPLGPLAETFCDVSTSADERNKSLNSIMVQLARPGSDLLSLVEAMAPQLTSMNTPIRKRGVALLGELLTRMPGLSLSANDVAYLCAFLTDRLRDGPSIPEALAATVALLGLQAHEQQAAVDLLLRVMSELGGNAVQSLAQPARLHVYRLFQLVLAQHPGVVLAPEMGEGGVAAVMGFVQAMDGEKDPRNLLTVFQVMAKLLALAPGCAELIEEIFDVTSCYFPITFKAPQAGSLGFSVADLVSGLRDALLGSPLLLPMTLPFLLDKLHSPLAATKTETLVTLSLLVRRYGGIALQSYSDALWAALREAVIGAVDVNVATEALRTLAVVVSTAATSLDDSPALLATVMAPILRDTHHELAHPDKKASRICGEILVVAAQAAPRACAFVLQSTLPPLVASLEEPHALDGVAGLGLLHILVAIVAAAAAAGVAIDSPERVLAILAASRMVASPQVRAACFEGSAALRRYLAHDDWMSAVQAAVEGATRDPDDAVRAAATAALLLLLSSLDEGVTATGAVGIEPELEAAALQPLVALADAALVSGLAPESERALALLPKLGAAKKSMYPRVLAAVWSVAKRGLSALPAAASLPATVAVMATYSTVNLVCGLDGSGDSRGCPSALRYAALAELVDLAIAGAVHADAALERAFERAVLIAGARLDRDHQIQLLARAQALLTNGYELPGVMGIAACRAVIGATSPNLWCPSVEATIVAAFADLFGLVAAGGDLTAPHPASIGRLIAVWCARVPLGADSSAMAVLTGALESGCAGGHAAVTAVFPHVLLGLAPRRAEASRMFLAPLVSALACPKVGLDAAAGLAVMFTPDWQYVDSKVCNTHAKLLWRQNVSGMLMGPCLESYAASRALELAGGQPSRDDAGPTTKARSNLHSGCGAATVPPSVPYMAAVVECALAVPKPVLLPYLTSLLPLLVHCLAVEAVAFRVKAVTLFTQLLAESTAAVLPYLNSLIASLCDLSAGGFAADIRASAIKALFVLGGLGAESILPYKKAVLAALAAPLDDPNRGIRKLAVAAANRWHVAGSAPAS